MFPGLTFDLLPGNFLRALIKLGFCANPFSERVCYDFMELVIGMDSDNVDKVTKTRKIGRHFDRNLNACPAF